MVDDLTSQRGRLLFAPLGAFYARFQPASYALLRFAFGLTMLTHGLPKLLGMPHGSMTDPMAGSIRLIDNVLHLPFAPMLALLVALLETLGGLMVAIGLLTRPLAAMMAVQMIFISLALGPTWPWIDRGIEYPVMLGFIALLIALRGGGPASLDRLIGREI
ncbi:DoxX family protein [Sphingomonas oleivorans]|uniref:DoxX family protein n=1 Tax=Sphingomonas oleivorans TaxID=1735121 RepID=A0A2T5FTN5_9SPHN|nr:DoxX family protein [Sphingomonas oleivorans]PTQ07430.1 DoxX family protein [Sphingomonas oleivorans]